MLMFMTVIEDEIARDQLETLFHLYHKDLWYVANGILKDEYEAQDVVQTAFIRVAKYLGEDFEPDCNRSRGLMVIIVRNLALNVYNHRKNHYAVPIEDVEFNLKDNHARDPEVHMLRLDQSAWMADQLAQVKKEYADIMTLKYTYEYSNSEIATMLDTSEGNVRIRLMRAKKALHKIMGGEACEQF